MRKALAAQVAATLTTSLPAGDGRKYVPTSIRAAQRGQSERTLARERERGGPEAEPFYRFGRKIFYLDGGDPAWLARRRFYSHAEELAAEAAA